MTHTKLDPAADPEQAWHVVVLSADPRTMTPEEATVYPGKLSARACSFEEALDLLREPRGVWKDGDGADLVVVAAFVTQGLARGPAFLEMLGEAWTDVVGVEDHEHVICEDCSKTLGLTPVA
jgi:hypothetical protein